MKAATPYYIIGDWIAVEENGGRYVGRIKQIRGTMLMVVFQPNGNWIPVHITRAKPAQVST